MPTVLGPDGQAHSFPDGMPSQQIHAAMLQRYGGAQGTQPKAAPPPMPAFGGPPQAAMPQPSAAAGYQPALPQRQFRSPDEANAIALDVALNNGRGLAGILQGTATEAGRKAEAVDLGKQDAIKRAQAGAAESLLANLQKVHEASTKAGPDVLTKAIGPNYHDPNEKDRSATGNFFNTVANLFTGATTKNSAVAYGLDSASPSYVAQMKARYGSGDPNKPNEYDRAAGLNTELHHFKKGIAALFKSIPGSGGASTNQAQTTLEEMVQAAINAPDAETHFKLLHDAQNFVNGLAQRPLMPDKERYTPLSFGIDPRAIQKLQAAPTPENMKFFEETFKLPEGSAKQLVGAK